MNTQRFPTLKNVLRPTVGDSAKTAAGPVDPGPDSDHPAKPEGNMPTPEGPTLTDDENKSIAARGDLAPEAVQGVVTDQPGVSINTEVGKDGDELRSEIPINDKIKDPGPDSSHPASTPEEKYAGVDTVEGVANVLSQVLEGIVAKLAMTESGPGDEEEGPSSSGGDKTKNSDEVPESDDEPTVPVDNKVASLEDMLEVICPSSSKVAGQPSPREQWNRYIGENIEPFVADGIERGERLATFHKLAMADPQAAEALMAGPEMMPPGAEGGMPMGDPGMMPPGGEMGGGGGEGGQMTEEEAIIEAILEIAEERGISPEQVIAELEGSAGEGAGMPPEAAMEAQGEPLEGAPSEGSPTEGDESGKAASAPQSKQASISDSEEDKDKKRRLLKIAHALLDETGKTPQEVAQGVC